jgi:hypothetical protein
MLSIIGSVLGAIVFTALVGVTLTAFLGAPSDPGEVDHEG